MTRDDLAVGQPFPLGVNYWPRRKAMYWWQDFDRDEVAQEVDVIACPTAPTAAFKIGEKSADPVAMYLSDAMTVPASLAGLPACSVPCGFVDSEGAELPVGMQVIGRPLADELVLAVARAFEVLPL